jgi:hypothetical protein
MKNEWRERVWEEEGELQHARSNKEQVERKSAGRRRRTTTRKVK